MVYDTYVPEPPAFGPPDRSKKEAAVRMALGTPAIRKTADYVPAEQYVADPPINKAPDPARILDRCIPAWPDPNAANVRAYMGTAVGTCNHPATWGLPYKYARGIRNPPGLSSVVYADAVDEKTFGMRSHPPWFT